MKKHGAAWAISLGLAVGIGIAAALLALLAPATASSSEVAMWRSAGGWETVSIDTFSGELGAAWRVTDTSDLDGGEYLWGLDTFTYTSPITAAWCMGGSEEVNGMYVDDMDTWLVYGPISLTEALDAYARFDWWLDTGGAVSRGGGALGLQATGQVSSVPEDGDWLGWCVLTEENGLDDASCTYVSGSIGQWTEGSISLSNHLPAQSAVSDTIWIAFRFVSDDDGVTGRGAFVDDLELRVKRGYKVMLPLVRRGPLAGPADLLHNSGFELDWSEAESHRTLVFPASGEPYETDVGNIFTPPGWLTWFYHDPGSWDQPEVHDMAGASQAVKEHRVRTGNSAMVLFTFFRKHDAGFLQQVDVQPGTRLRASAFAHAWSNDHSGPHPDDGLWSEGPGYDCGFALEGAAENDDWRNFTFWVGIDPTGGVDPYAETVVWGDGAHIYNCYGRVPAVEAEAQAHKVTIFLRSRTQWAFKHNDAYWDDAEVVAVGEAPEPVEWDYPVVDKGSRIGVHALHAGQVPQFATELIAGGTHFPVVKAVDDLGWLPGIRAISPETVIIARLTSGIEGAPHVEDPGTDLDELANALLSFILNKITVDPVSCGVVDYWEVVNEPDPPGSEGYRRLAELMIKCMEKAEAHGLKLALFSLNAGTPEWDEMQAMVATGAFTRAREGRHILALHEGTFSSHDPTECWGFGIPGSPDVEGAGCLNFRYRYLYHLLEQRREVVPLVVSEWYCGDEQSASTETLVNALKWYDGQASDEETGDYYFWAACPFTLGAAGQWKDTDYRRVYEGGLVDYMIEVNDRQNATPPAPSGVHSLPLILRTR
ncbi:MAG: hypothetical protein PVI07_08345 [Anaerolineae bacterium]|jgi:hypothetical protein